ncbi:MAG: LacI family DNA-binding transcriptional regulator [Phycisphaeraceae bacterium]
MSQSRKNTPRAAIQAPPVTTRELSRRLNVNQSTVSRSLNGDPRISPQLASRIRRMADELGYRPQPMRSKRKQALGLLIASDRVDKSDNQFISRIILEVEQVASGHGQHVNVAFIPREGGAADTPIPSIIAQNRVDGLLLAGHPPASVVNQIRSFDLPMIAINDVSERLNISCVRFDPSQATREAVVGLHRLGHRRIAIVLHRLDYPTNRLRDEAYRQAMAELNLPVADALRCVNFPRELQGGHLAVEHLLALEDPPTAVLFGNDWMALGAYHALLARGLKVPEDLSIVGHDDVWFTQDPTLQITTVARDERALVERAVGTLLEAVESETQTVDEQTISTAVVWRQSTGAPNAVPDSVASNAD